VNTNMEEETYHQLFETLNFNTSIERLYLGANALTSKSMIGLSKMLENNSTLKGLFLSVNDIGDEGIEYLSKGLMKNNTLEELGLGSCGISDGGIDFLSKILMNNSQLQYLDLSYAPSTKVMQATGNSISDEATSVLIDALQHNKSLKGINLIKTNLSSHSKSKIETNRSLYSLKNISVDGRDWGNFTVSNDDAAAIRSVYR
jgi:Ran GTPase-activating protein (RanGAP) involved in mRNA processing and transport